MLREGYGDGPFSGLMGGLNFYITVSVDEGLGFSPFGETEEGFVRANQ